MRVRLQHTHIFASDLEATLGFWQEMFDARILFDEDIAGARNVMISIGPGRLNIYDQPPREGGGGAYHHLGLQTDDLDALVEHMRNRGFRFRDEIRELGFLRYIMAMAPDNILLEIFQIVPEELAEGTDGALSQAFAFDDP